ncbi:hypothetical protein D3C71_2045520 [compost metagenome]
MNSMPPQYLANMFKSWTMDDLIWQRDVLGATEREILDVTDEIKRREGEKDAQRSAG